MGAARTHSCHCLSSPPFHPSTPALPLSSPLSSCRSPLHHFQNKVSAHKTDSPHLNHPQLSRQIIHHSAECFLCISPLVSHYLVIRLPTWEEILLLTSNDPDSPFLLASSLPNLPLTLPRTSFFFSAVSRSHAHHAFKCRLFADVVSGSR